MQVLSPLDWYAGPCVMQLLSPLDWCYWRPLSGPETQDTLCVELDHLPNLENIHPGTAAMLAASAEINMDHESCHTELVKKLSRTKESV